MVAMAQCEATMRPARQRFSSCRVSPVFAPRLTELLIALRIRQLALPVVLQVRIAVFKQQLEVGGHQPRSTIGSACQIEQYAMRGEIDSGERLQGLCDLRRPLRHRRSQNALQDAEDTIGGHQPADAGLLLEPAGRRDQPFLRRADVLALQCRQDAFGKPVEVGQMGARPRDASAHRRRPRVLHPARSAAHPVCPGHQSEISSAPPASKLDPLEYPPLQQRPPGSGAVFQCTVPSGPLFRDRALFRSFSCFLQLPHGIRGVAIQPSEVQ